MLTRFNGSVEPFATVDITDLARWVGDIPFEQWPQQHRLEDGQIRPSMITDLAWRDFGERTQSVVNELLGYFNRSGAAYQRMLSVVMPGHSIEPHKDGQAPYWLCRVHVPLFTNEQSSFIVDGETHAMKIGVAYRVNTLAEHSVTNYGNTPRIHFMMDVRSL